jgi:transposase InsO family protein
MDFVHDQLINGLAFRVLTVIDNWSRESVLLEVGFRLTGQSVIDALNRISKLRKLPASITVDHGTEFTSLVMEIGRTSIMSVWPLQDPVSPQTMGFANHLMVDSEMNV